MNSLSNIFIEKKSNEVPDFFKILQTRKSKKISRIDNSFYQEDNNKKCNFTQTNFMKENRIIKVRGSN